MLRGAMLPPEPTPERLTSDPARLFQLHASLREQLMQAIRQEKGVEIDSLVRRGAPLLPHYHSMRLDLPAEAAGARPEGYFTSKGPRPGMVNPVDWAALEHKFHAAMQLLRLGDDRLVFSRDENQSFLVQLSLARQTQRAVHVAASREQLELLRMLLERRADPGQRNGKGESALLAVVRDGKESPAELLLEFGAWSCEARKREVLERAAARRMACVLKAAGVAAQGGACPGEDLAVEEVPPWDALVSDFAGSPEAERAFKLDRVAERSLSPDASTRCPSRSSQQRWEGAARAPQRGPASPRTRTEVRAEDAALRKALRGAVQKGDVAEIRSLVHLGAPLDVTFELGYGEHGNCVDFACVSERPAAALALLELADGLGCGGELAWGTRSALYWCVLKGYLEVLRALLGRGADAGQRNPRLSSGSSPLALAVFSWRGEEALELLRHGAWGCEPQAQREELLAGAKARRSVARAFVEAGVLPGEPG